MGRSIGKAIRGFKEGLSEIDVSAKDIHDDNHKKAQPAPPQPTSQIPSQEAATATTSKEWTPTATPAQETSTTSVGDSPSGSKKS